ncbi:MAG TPA: hypothetical protein VHJ76_02450, partial [Actinomycetota bacterium]|nr:hypothetical protein [Actinomycetota bacterium]
PLVASAIAVWAVESRRRLAWAAGLGLAGIVTWAYLLAEVVARRATLIVDFYETSNPLYRVWSLLLPDYRNPTTSTWVLHALWAAVALACVWRVARRPSPGFASPAGSG